MSRGVPRFNLHFRKIIPAAAVVPAGDGRRWFRLRGDHGWRKVRVTLR